MERSDNPNIKHYPPSTITNTIPLVASVLAQRLQNQPRSPHPNYPYPQAAQNELRNDFVVASSVPDDPNLRNKQGNQHQSNPYQIQNRGCHPPPQPQNPPIQKNVPESLKRKVRRRKVRHYIS